MSLLRNMFDKLTYRTSHSDPGPVDRLVVTNGRWGARTVHHLGLPAVLEARRRRMLRDGMDPVDLALLDADTAALLAATAARMDDAVGSRSLLAKATERTGART